MSIKEVRLLLLPAFSVSHLMKEKEIYGARRQKEKEIHGARRQSGRNIAASYHNLAVFLVSLPVSGIYLGCGQES